ncbi:MAG TPA: M48 family metallopeptidase [Verrucomicrobiae bacterium]|nr:M48 family metallopeptidase [Verrucomicrobiae bacterium]
MWEVIASNRRRSILLIIVMGVMLVILGYVAGEAMFWGVAHHQLFSRHHHGYSYQSYDSSDVASSDGTGGMIGVGLALVILTVMLVVYFTSAEDVLLHGTSARELKREDSPQLFNVVDEMVLASGLGFTPKIYLIDDDAPNAFAVGRKPETSAVCVTSGLLYRLNRDELQGVIGHEIGHMKNRDVQFMTLAAVMLGSIVILSVIVRQYFWYGGRVRTRSSSRDGEGGAAIIILIVGLLFAILGPIMAQILYFACSRKREYLADASSAEFTRYPEGLASALEKIAGAHVPASFASEATAPMFIVNPLTAASGEADSVFSSHPPTADRVRILRAMTGASFADYEAAWRRAKGGSLIGSQTLKSATAQTIRAPSNDGPIQSRRETHDVVRRYHGYMRLHCNCGLDISVPEGYEQDTIRCIRCGSVLTILAAAPAPPAKPDVIPPVIAGIAPPVLAPTGMFQFQRTNRNSWESFRCACGRTIQLSPAFAAPHVTCTACGRTIQIT